MTQKLGSQIKHIPVVNSLTKPSFLRSVRDNWTMSVYLLVLFLIGGGVVNAVVNARQVGINNSPIVLTAGAQNTTETIIMLFIYGLGSLGIFGLYKSGRQVIRARAPGMFLVSGIAFVVLSLILGYYVLAIKCPPSGVCG